MLPARALQPVSTLYTLMCERPAWPYVQSGRRPGMTCLDRLHSCKRSAMLESHERAQYCCIILLHPYVAADECGSSGQPSMTLAHTRHTPLNNFFFDSSTVRLVITRGCTIPSHGR